MSKTTQINQSRIALDAKFVAMRSTNSLYAKPKSGWVRTIRQALGMSLSDLSERTQLNTSTLSRLEATEAAGKSNLETLQTLADALDCDLVYALLPRTSLEEQVQQRARQVAATYLRRTQQTMALEQQGLSPAAYEILLNDLTQKVAESKALWGLADSDLMRTDDI